MRISLKTLLALIVLCMMAMPGYAQQNRKPLTPGQYIDQVNSYFSQHRWDKGKELLDESLDKYPKDPNLHYLAGRYWYHVKNYDKSRYHLVKSCNLNYNHIDAKNLLVNVEELTGNYSSAICYVNELLEINPYWKGLWLRKVDLYRKQGNFEEATAILRRLRQIYPNDSTISSDWFEVLSTTYEQARKNGDMESAEDALREMVIIYPNDADYQLAYANMLISKGKTDEAMQSLTAAINIIPGNVDLVRKATDILMSTGHDASALSLVRGQMETHPSPELRALYNRLLSSSAEIENEADPYQLYTKVYATRHSSDALNYLIKESYRRGYNDDALTYIAAKRRASGDTPGLSMMEYEVQHRMGHPEEAARVLRSAEIRYPDNYDINIAACRQRLKDASEAMAEERYDLAIDPLEYVRTNCMEEEYRTTAIRRLAVCYTEVSEFDKAKEMLRERLRTETPAAVTADYAQILVKQGKTDEALNELYLTWNDTKDEAARQSLVYAYEETAIPVIKNGMQEGSYPYVLSLCDTLLKMDPTNYWALRYASQAAEDPERYVDAGMAEYPDDVSFRIRKASLLVKNDRCDEAMDLLRDIMQEHPGDESLTGAFVTAASRKAELKMKEKDYDGAAAVLDSALFLRPTDKELMNARGLVYEKQKQWDSAYVYQRYYIPGPLEEREFLQKMRALRNRGYRNTADVGYDFFRFATSHNITGIATAGYNHTGSNGISYGGRINYSARDEYVEGGRLIDTGGRGFQIQGTFGKQFSKEWEMSADAAFGHRYFPIVSLNVSGKHTFPSDWEQEAGLMFRVMQDTTIMTGANIASAISVDHFYFGGKLTAGVFHNRFFANGSVRARAYPFDGGRTFIEAQAGAGSAPEMDFINIYFDSYLFNHLNSFVSLAANWLLADNLSVNLSGTWNTLYDQRDKVVSYRNMLVGHVQFVVYF